MPEDSGPINRTDVGIAVLAGGPVGELIASGVGKYDQLLSIDLFMRGAHGFERRDVTEAFAISVNNRIENVGDGLDTSGGTLIVTYWRDGAKRWAAAQR